MLLPSPKKLKHRENDFLSRTGVSKAGYLLKRLNRTSFKSQWRWESSFLILNDHSLTYCSEKNNFTSPEGNLLLTVSTRVYNQQGDDEVIRIETGTEVLFLKGSDMADWKKAIHFNVTNLSNLARGQFGVKWGNIGRVNDQFIMLHK